MINKISKTEAIRARIKDEGNVTILNKPAHISAITTMNKRLEVSRREYQVKDKNSQTTASYVILTT